MLFWLVVGMYGCCFVAVRTPFFFSSKRRHTRLVSDWSSDVCSSDLLSVPVVWLVRALNALGIRRRRVAPLDLVELDRGTRAAMSQGGSGTIARRHAAPWVDLATTPTAVYLQSLMAVNRGVADLEAIRVPVLALLSTGGAPSDPVLTERRLRALTNCRLLRLAAEHWIPTEQPEAMRNAIEEWCTELATAARP